MKRFWLSILVAIFSLKAVGAPPTWKLLPPPDDLPLPANLGVYFSPGDNIEAAVVKALDLARSEILISQGAITSVAIGEAIVNAFKRKVVVGIILQKNPPIKNYQTPAYFDAHRVPYVYAATEARHDQKYCVIDRRIVLTGSFDWLASALANNENLLVIDDPSVAACYVRNWQLVAQETRIPDLARAAVSP